MTPPTYRTRIDWGKDGSFATSGDDVSARLLDSPPITISRGRDIVNQLGGPAAGRFNGALDNRSRDYSTEHAGSPLVGKLKPGRRLSHQAQHNAITYDLFGGILEDLPQNPDERKVGIPARGTLSRLIGTERLSTQVYTNIRTDQAIGHVLNAIGWPAGERVLGTGKTTMAYWWLEQEDAFAAIVRLLNTEGPGASIYERGDGYFVFENRHYRLTTSRSTTSQATFRDVDNGSDLYHNRPFLLDAHLKDVINTVQIPVNLRTVASLADVWSLGGTLVLPPYASTQIVAVSASGEPFVSAVTPANATDYTVSVGGLASLTLSRTSGVSTVITIVAGASGVTLTGLKLRAQLLNRATIRVANTIDCSASIDSYGVQTLNETKYPVWPEIAVNDAQDFANAIAAAYREPRATATITVKAGNNAHIVQCLGREISDRVHVVEAQSGLDSDMYIERIEHTIDRGGLRHATRFGLEKASAVNQYAVWGSAVWGSSVWAY